MAINSTDCHAQPVAFDVNLDAFAGRKTNTRQTQTRLADGRDKTRLIPALGT